MCERWQLERSSASRWCEACKHTNYILSIINLFTPDFYYVSLGVQRFCRCCCLSDASTWFSVFCWPLLPPPPPSSSFCFRSRFICHFFSALRFVSYSLKSLFTVHCFPLFLFFFLSACVDRFFFSFFLSFFARRHMCRLCAA